jgi:hypothetical protein
MPAKTRSFDFLFRFISIVIFSVLYFKMIGTSDLNFVCAGIFNRHCGVLTKWVHYMICLVLLYFEYISAAVKDTSLPGLLRPQTLVIITQLAVICTILSRV